MKKMCIDCKSFQKYLKTKIWGDQLKLLKTTSKLSDNSKNRLKGELKEQHLKKPLSTSTYSR